MIFWAALLTMIIFVGGNSHDLGQTVDPRQELSCSTSPGINHEDVMMADWKEISSVRQVTLHCRQKIRLPSPHLVAGHIAILINDLKQIPSMGWHIKIGRDVPIAFPKLVPDLIARFMSSGLACFEPTVVDSKLEACSRDRSAIYISTYHHGLQAEICENDQFYSL